jgi:hypothetical protein
MLPEPAQWRRPVLSCRGPQGIARFSADLFRIVQKGHSPARTAQDVGVIRRPVAGGASRFAVTAASQMLNEQLGTVTRVEQNGGYVIRGEGCPLPALTGKHPAVCRAMESLVKEFVGAAVHECCERAQRPRLF